MMAMVFATIFFTVILAGAMASLAVSMCEALAMVGREAARAELRVAVRRRVRVSRPLRSSAWQQPQRAAA